MYTTQAIDIPFWGSRTYVHGSFLIAELLGSVEQFATSAPRALQCSFHFPLKTKTRFDFSRDPAEIAAGKTSYPATFKITCDDGDIFAAAFPLDTPPDSPRFPDDEAALLQEYRLTDDTQATISGYPDSRPYGALIALTKRLHLETLPQNDSGRWLLAQLQFKTLPPDTHAGKPIRAAIKRVLANKMSITDIFLGDACLGQIYFNKRASQ